MGEWKEKIVELWKLADDYVREELRVGDVALLKVCLLSLGVIIGACLPRKWKRPAVFTMLFVFLVTYLPLVTRWGAYLGKTCCALKKAAGE